MITSLLITNDIFAEDDFIYDNIRGLANPCIEDSINTDIYSENGWDSIAEALDKYFIYQCISSYLSPDAYLSHIS